MAANFVQMHNFGKQKFIWKEEMSHGGSTWYMDSTLEELKIMLAFG